MGHDSNAPGWAVFFFLVAFALSGVGFFVMFHYPPAYGYEASPPMGHIVGNDADNFIIIATRGVGFIAAGIVCALAGVSCMVSAVLDHLRTRPAAAAEVAPTGI